MASKAQIAKKMYNCALVHLSSGERAAVTKAYNKQTTAAPARRSRARATPSSSYATVKFARPGVNGVKESVVDKGTSVGDALKQAEIILNTSKEGIVTKEGSSVFIDDQVVDGKMYLIVPGVDSSE